MKFKTLNSSKELAHELHPNLPVAGYRVNARRALGKPFLPIPHFWSSEVLRFMHPGNASPYAAWLRLTADVTAAGIHRRVHSFCLRFPPLCAQPQKIIPSWAGKGRKGAAIAVGAPGRGMGRVVH